MSWVNIIGKIALGLGGALLAGKGVSDSVKEHKREQDAKKKREQDAKEQSQYVNFTQKD